MQKAEGVLAGKRGLVLGVANDRSIAWGITQAAVAHGAEVALTYQGDALAKRVFPLAESLNIKTVIPCDVTDDLSLDAAFETVAKTFGTLDFVVHAVAFSDKEELKGKFLNTTRRNFAQTMDISCYSLAACAQRAAPLMKNGGSIVTLTYFGAERVMPHYNVMGVAKAALEASVRYLAADMGEQNIRVNAISAGPIRTLAASGIGDFRHILRWNELNSPLKRNVTLEQVGHSALYFLSDWSAGVTGEVHHVDSGYHVVGMMRTEAAPQLADMLKNFSNSQG